jgi:hypothetical protein
VLHSLRMIPKPSAEPVFRFGAFEVDPRTGELRKQGVKIKLRINP